MNKFIEKTTRHFRVVIHQSFHHAALAGTKVVTPLHVLYALLCERGSIGEEILKRAGLKPEILTNIMNGSDAITLHRTTILSPNAKRAIEKAVARAARDGHAYVGTEHLLHGIIEIDSDDVRYLLNQSGVSKKVLRQQTDIALKSASKLPELLNHMWGATRLKQTKKTATEKLQKPKLPALDYFATELTDPTYAAGIDQVIGRESEIERLVHVLARRTKNNPLLIGEAGVGKTAIVEGLAKRIVAADVPPTLLNKRIFSIDLGLVVAGTMYRGEFESRLKQLVEETKNNPDIILFIDELHSIVGAGSSNGNMDAANLLKPALARGDLHVIGATTHDEFKKHIEHDSALERRFQPIVVNEPTALETADIIRHIKGSYEKFHHVQLSDEAIEAATGLAEKYFPEKRFPDKALDLIDEAMSAKKVKHARADIIAQRSVLIQQLRDCVNRKQQAVIKEDFEKAQKLKHEEMQLEADIASLDALQSEGSGAGVVTAQDVNAVVARILRRPISELAEKINAFELGTFLRTKIFGQDEVISSVVQAITRAQLGLANEKRPLASFLFVGSTGVGKTELAKLIAQGVYHDPKALIKIDLNEFSEGFSVSKLLGAPAGYVGHRESTTLVDRIRRQPMSVIVFDEVDKAHPDILSVLLQMLEEGRLADATGKEASVKQSIIILTYQLPNSEITGGTFGFNNSEMLAVRPLNEIKQSLYNVMKPELLNRIDTIEIFKPLSEQTRATIARAECTALGERFARRGIILNFASDVAEQVAKNSETTNEGARRIRHLIAEEIEKPLINLVTMNSETLQYRIACENGILVVAPQYVGINRSNKRTTRRRRHSRTAESAIREARY